MLIASDQFRIVVGLGKSGLSVVRHLASRGLPFAVVDTRANPPELATLAAQYPQVSSNILRDKALSKETEADLKRGIEAFKKTFVAR